MFLTSSFSILKNVYLMRQFCSCWLIFRISMNNNFRYFFMFLPTLMHIFFRFMVKYAVTIHIQLWSRIGIQVKSWMQREWRLRTRGMRSNGYVRIENDSGNIREDWECMVLRGVLITRDNYVYCTYKESRASCKSNLFSFLYTFYVEEIRTDARLLGKAAW